MGGRKQNGVNYKSGGSASGRNDIRAAVICREGYYGVFRADGVRENVWVSSDNTGVFEKLLKWQADVGGESGKCARFKCRRWKRRTCSNLLGW